MRRAFKGAGVVFVLPRPLLSQVASSAPSAGSGASTYGEADCGASSLQPRSKKGNPKALCD